MPAQGQQSQPIEILWFVSNRSVVSDSLWFNVALKVRDVNGVQSDIEIPKLQAADYAAVFALLNDGQTAFCSRNDNNAIDTIWTGKSATKPTDVLTPGPEGVDARVIWRTLCWSFSTKKGWISFQVEGGGPKPYLITFDDPGKFSATAMMLQTGRSGYLRKGVLTTAVDQSEDFGQ